MMRDSQKLEAKSERIGNFITGDKHQAFFYWLIGVTIVIPILTYASVLLNGLILGTIFSLLGTSEAYVGPIMLALTVVCCAASVIAYYKLWIMYKGRNGNSKGTT